MTEQEWKKLEKNYLADKITFDEMLDKTENEDEHPEWWEHPCVCDLCKSYGI